jgi:predicted RNA-binding protein
MKWIIVTRTVTAQVSVPLSDYGVNATVEDAIRIEREADDSTVIDVMGDDENVVQSVRIDVFDDGKVEG